MIVLLLVYLRRCGRRPHTLAVHLPHTPPPARHTHSPHPICTTSSSASAPASADTSAFCAFSAIATASASVIATSPPPPLARSYIQKHAQDADEQRLTVADYAIMLSGLQKAS